MCTLSASASDPGRRERRRSVGSRGRSWPGPKAYAWCGEGWEGTTPGWLEMGCFNLCAEMGKGHNHEFLTELAESRWAHSTFRLPLSIAEFAFCVLSSMLITLAQRERGQREGRGVVVKRDSRMCGCKLMMQALRG